MSKKIIKCLKCGEYKPHKCKGYCNKCYQQLRYERLKESEPFKKCECDPNCPEMVPSVNTKGRKSRFAICHQFRNKKPHNFKGYKIDKKDNYIYSHSPDHPFRTVDKYVRTHRLIFEHYLYIMFDEHVYIPKNIDIHHINGNVQDNSLINLEPLEHSEHSSLSSNYRWNNIGA